MDERLRRLCGARLQIALPATCPRGGRYVPDRRVLIPRPIWPPSILRRYDCTAHDQVEDQIIAAIVRSKLKRAPKLWRAFGDQ